MAVERHAGDLGDGIPHRHVDDPDGDRALAVPARLLVGHHGGPDPARVEVVAGFVAEACRVGLLEARQKALAQPATGGRAAGGGTAERHVGKEWVSTGRSMQSQYHKYKKTITT